MSTVTIGLWDFYFAHAIQGLLASDPQETSNHQQADGLIQKALTIADGMVDARVRMLGKLGDSACRNDD